MSTSVRLGIRSCSSASSLLNSFGVTTQRKIRDPQPGQELGHVRGLPVIAGEDDDPGQDHARTCGQLADSEAKHKERDTSSVFDRDGPQHAQVFGVEVTRMHPASNVGKGVAEPDHIADAITQLFPESILVERDYHPIVQSVPNERQGEEDGDARGEVKPDVPAERRGRQAVDESFKLSPAHQNEEAVSQHVARDDEEQGHHAGAVV